MFITFSHPRTPVDRFTGSDVPEALQPKDVIPAAGGGPFSSKVKLGRVINGPTGREPKYVLLLQEDYVTTLENVIQESFAE